MQTLKTGPNKTSFVFREVAKYTVKTQFAALTYFAHPDSWCLGNKVKKNWTAAERRARGRRGVGVAAG